MVIGGYAVTTGVGRYSHADELQPRCMEPRWPNRSFAVVRIRPCCLRLLIEIRPAPLVGMLGTSRGDAALDGRAGLGDHAASRGFCMNRIEPGFASVPRVAHSVCPHDCPSTCALEVEVLDERTIGRARAAEDNDYTLGVICAKVARYAERVHHPDRLVRPLRRTGPKGSGDFAEISWDDALDLVAENFDRAERRHGTEAVWPYYYAGTMGLLMRDGINRLRHVKKYSGFYSTICNTPARVGFLAGTGRLAGPDPREMAKSDLVVIWGTNEVNTPVNVTQPAPRSP